MPLIPERIQYLLERPVAVLGGGVSGLGAEALLKYLGADAKIYDQRAAADLREFTVSNARSHRLAIYSPGFSPSHRWLQAAHEAGVVCMGELDFASLFWHGKLIAITGTNGKTTLTEFLVHALKTAGQNACAVGNIGFPLSRIHEHKLSIETYAVCEISSFQAETLENLRPDATLWTNFAEDHLERHGTMQTYFEAKARLLSRTPEAARFVGSSVYSWSCYLKRPLKDVTVVKTEELLDEIPLMGSPFERFPQRENFELARAWWRFAQLDESLLLEAAHTFIVGRHRLERVNSYGGVTWWNDSKATNFHAVEAAVRNFHLPVRLIVGGKSKGGDIRNFTRSLAGRVRKMYVIGETAPEIAEGATEASISYVHCQSLAEAVDLANKDSKPGDNILLSPGFASFDMFRNYEDRGEQFVAAVKTVTTSKQRT